MILLVDKFDESARLLASSLDGAGYDCPVVSINYDGFSPVEVTSPFSYYIGDEDQALEYYTETKNVDIEDMPALFFDRVPVPEFWEITGSNSGGEIIDYTRKRADLVFVDPKHLRYVKEVCWKDENGRVFSIDHYNRFGRKFATTSMDAEGRQAVKTYFDKYNREVIIQNFKTGTILLSIYDEDDEEMASHPGTYENPTFFMFNDLIEFLYAFLLLKEFDLSHLLINSLSTPLFAADRIRRANEDIAQSNILFWQEPIHDDIPGNMRSILRGYGAVSLIAVQSQEAYDRIASIVTPDELRRFVPLGFIYGADKHEPDFEKPKAVVFTNSDQVEHLEYIAEQLPEVSISVAAITEMSSKLLSMDRYPNVHLYPNVRREVSKRLMDEADIYLDINYVNEILDAIRDAFMHGIPILGFKETVHNKAYVANTHLYDANDEGAAALVRQVKDALRDMETYDGLVSEQKKYALDETPERYRGALSSVL